MLSNCYIQMQFWALNFFYIELSVYNFLPSNSVICIEFIFNVTIRLARVLIYDDINEIELKNLLLRLRG